MPNAIIDIKNFGPIKKGQFELKPLTIFLGQNNTGKTYCALLVYAIYQAILGRIPETMPSAINKIRLNTQNENQWSSDLRQIKEFVAKNHRIHLSDLPDFTRKILSEYINESIKRLPQSMEIALHKYFQYQEPNELICSSETNPRSLIIDIKSSDGNSYLNLKVAPRGKNVRVTCSVPDNDLVLGEKELASIGQGYPTSIVISNLFSNYFRSIFSGLNSRRVYYLPAARSGTLQVWPIMGATITEYYSRAVGLHPIKIGVVPGITQDFMTMIYDLIARDTISNNPKLEKVISYMETEMLGGQVGTFTKGEIKTPTFCYSTPKFKIDLSRSSSMVAELAPLDLLMKRILRPGDLLILDEPEAHLHPENQRKAALLLARLVKNGVKIICTTHSHIFLHQISNLVLASSLKPEKKEQLQITDSCLEKSDVNVYLFEKKDSVVNIKNIPIIESVGYSEDEYVKVYEKLLEENQEITGN